MSPALMRGPARVLLALPASPEPFRAPFLSLVRSRHARPDDGNQPTLDLFETIMVHVER